MNINLAQFELAGSAGFPCGPRRQPAWLAQIGCNECACPSQVPVSAGLDSAEIVSQLRAAHAEGETLMGVDVLGGGIGDMAAHGICESFKVRHPLLLRCRPFLTPTLSIQPGKRGVLCI